MKNIDAEIEKVDGMYRILATVDGERLYLGNNIDGLLFKYVEYNTNLEALAHIERSERLIFKG